MFSWWAFSGHLYETVLWNFGHSLELPGIKGDSKELCIILEMCKVKLSSFWKMWPILSDRNKKSILKLSSYDHIYFTVNIVWDMLSN